jgi:uncharacterized protein (DUF4415 family)
MSNTLKTKSGRILRIPSAREEAEIARGIAQDPDAAPLTDAEWEAIKPRVQMGRPPSPTPHKIPTTIRFDADVLAALKATGKGWQTRVNDAMRNWVKRHPHA